MAVFDDSALSPVWGDRGPRPALLLEAAMRSTASPDDATTASESITSGPAANADGRLIYRLLLAIDIEKYSVRHARDQFLVQTDLSHALDTAALRAGLNRRLWEREVRGDGELAVLPEGVDASQVIGGFTRELGRAIGALNLKQPQRPRLRVRLALHYGTLTPGPFGPAGDAPIVVSRLLDAKPVRTYLAQRQDLDLALVVSASLYQDVVSTGFCSLDPDRFQALRIKVKGTSYQGYTYAPAGRGRRAALIPQQSVPRRPGPHIPTVTQEAKILSLPRPDELTTR
jgi:class 3 adenylate cyclase